MKKRQKIVLLLIMNIILIGTFYNIIYKNEVIINEKQIVKEMIQSENESNLQTQIDALNAAHEEYASNVQNYKKQISEAITSQGVTTSENDTGSVMAENIGKILSAKTTATATAADIVKGKTAWVNGEKVVGTGGGATIKYLGYVSFSYGTGNWGDKSKTFNVASVYEDYKNLSVNNFVPLTNLYTSSTPSANSTQTCQITFKSMSYNASTGVLTVTINMGSGAGNYVSWSATIPIYIAY